MAKTPAWRSACIHTTVGEFDVFMAGDGSPLCVTHDYSGFNGTGDHFAARFVPH